MAPGIGGFNIDAPKPEGKAFKGHIAVAHTPASPMQNLVSQAPLQAQRMAAMVESGETSLVPRLFAVIAIAGLPAVGVSRRNTKPLELQPADHHTAM